MTAEAWLLLGTLATAAGTLLAAWLRTRPQQQQTKTTDAQQIIDQLQEMRATDEERHQKEKAEAEERHRQALDALRGEMAELRGRVGRMEDDRLTYFDYVAALRAHIDERLPPPPPPFPPALMHRRSPKETS